MIVDVEPGEIQPVLQPVVERLDLPPLLVMLIDLLRIQVLPVRRKDDDTIVVLLLQVFLFCIAFFPCIEPVAVGAAKPFVC